MQSRHLHVYVFIFYLTSTLSMLSMIKEQIRSKNISLLQ